MKNFNIEIIMKKLVLIGAINWGLIGFFDFNIVEFINQKLTGDDKTLSKIVYIIVGLSAIGLFKRDNLLPFLGRAVYPCPNLKEKIPDHADSKITVKVSPNSNVIYWAAEKNNKKLDNPWTAYDKYGNSGAVENYLVGIWNLIAPDYNQTVDYQTLYKEYDTLATKGPRNKWFSNYNGSTLTNPQENINAIHKLFGDASNCNLLMYFTYDETTQQYNKTIL